MGSKSFKLDMSDVWTVMKNALLVALAAFLTAVMNNLHLIDLGVYTAMVIPVVSLILDTVIKWVKNNDEETEETEKE